MCPFRTRKKEVANLIKVFFTVFGILLITAALFAGEWDALGEQFACGSIGFLMLAICQPSAVFACFKGIWNVLAILMEGISEIIQARSLKQKKKTDKHPALTMATLNEKQLVGEIATEQEYQGFLNSHVLEKSFITRVVGVTFPNDDGSDRQEILSKCLRGDPVAFYWHDFRGAPACAVITDHGQIGYLRAKLAADLDIDYGGDVYVFSGKISDVTGGVDGLSYGCNIMINIYGPVK